MKTKLSQLSKFVFVLCKYLSFKNLNLRKRFLPRARGVGTHPTPKPPPAPKNIFFNIIHTARSLRSLVPTLYKIFSNKFEFETPIYVKRLPGLRIRTFVGKISKVFRSVVKAPCGSSLLSRNVFI